MVIRKLVLILHPEIENCHSLASYAVEKTQEIYTIIIL